ncbi:hypothetical protein SELMODRAFT_127216 [Selaginella moellendorffii]|uniref:ZIP family transporter n=1 Tax=Selaginella moellendorffii TaxID=88036 RepID=D8SXC3_SELML|nr:zinc transporter 4, chloroplastic [Selaginella moellendorffii]EFJ10861.1 hypothetical protein SELMODRAFT_127216 [Selaginella moellendorffii]|eukprot:XP_002988069.1 zinc transporter 4, chloroplastic [Selaginella moellendorffii]
MSAVCISDATSCIDADAARRLNVGALFAILITSILGVAVPLLVKGFTQGRLFFAGRCFSAGIILATGFVHLLPESFDTLGSDCLPEMPWGKFPFAGLIAMLAVIFTLCMDTMGMTYYTRLNAGMDKDQKNDLELATTASNNGNAVVEPRGHGGHSHTLDIGVSAEARNKVIAQVLELGIITHSVVIGIGMGVLKSPCTIRPLIAALCFHQFFEGMALGGCICLGDFTIKTQAIMAFFFSFTTPAGMAIGLGIASTYNEFDHKALLIQGFFNSTSSGILVYMALVDLIATDFLSKEFFTSIPRQVVGYSSLLLGAILMSIIGIWA